MRKFNFTKKLPTHNSDKYEKEYFLIFSILVAGKKASIAMEKTWRLLEFTWGDETPFDYIYFLIKKERLMLQLHQVKIGQYDRINRALRDIIKLDVNTCTLDDLLACHGVGSKTARFFLTHTRKDAEYAVLDTHILKWLKGIIGSSVPKSTPSGKKYLQLEKKCIDLLKLHFPKLSLAEADFEIWKRFAKV
jgi:thermostable 8-oxoguanine DNA glycosylase